MSTLVVMGYKDEATAEQAYNAVQQMSKDLLAEVQTSAVVSRDAQGKYHVDTGPNPIGDTAGWGAFWGMLFGLLFLVPIAGLAFGAGMGALMGWAGKAGIDKDLIERVKGMLEPGSSALFLVLGQVTADKFIDGLKPYGGEVLQSSLSVEDEEHLKQVMAETE